MAAILFSLTWKEQATPAGRSFSLLRASARRTGDTDRTGWPTPQAPDAVGRSLGQKAIHGAKHGCAYLARSADLAGWRDANRRPPGWAPAPTMGGPELTSVAQLAGWPTPTKGNADGSQQPRDASSTGRREDDAQGDGGASVDCEELAGWQTPTVNDSRNSDYSYSQGNHDKPFLKLPGEAKLAGGRRRWLWVTG